MAGKRVRRPLRSPYFDTEAAGQGSPGEGDQAGEHSSDDCASFIVADSAPVSVHPEEDFLSDSGVRSAPRTPPQVRRPLSEVYDNNAKHLRSQRKRLRRPDRQSPVLCRPSYPRHEWPQQDNTAELALRSLEQRLVLLTACARDLHSAVGMLRATLGHHGTPGNAGPLGRWAGLPDEDGVVRESPMIPRRRQPRARPVVASSSEQGGDPSPPPGAQLGPGSPDYRVRVEDSDKENEDAGEAYALQQPRYSLRRAAV